VHLVRATDVVHLVGATGVVHLVGATGDVHLVRATGDVHLVGATGDVHLVRATGVVQLVRATGVVHLFRATDASALHCVRLAPQTAIVRGVGGRAQALADEGAVKGLSANASTCGRASSNTMHACAHDPIHPSPFPAPRDAPYSLFVAFGAASLSFIR